MTATGLEPRGRAGRVGPAGRRVLAAAIVRVVIAVAAGMAAPATAAAQGAAAGPGVLRVVAPWEIGSLDPSSAGYVFTRLEVAETLVDADDAGTLIPGLASSWTVSSDQLSWRFTLRRGARFHDGSPVTADAVVRALERARARPGLLRSVPIKSISASGAEVLVELGRPFAALPAFLAHSSTLVLAPASFAADGSVQSIIGSGPYKVASMQPPQKIAVQRFDGWQGGKPAIERVEYLAAGRAETRSLLARSGQADLVFTHDPANFETLRRQAGIVFHSLPIPRAVYLKVNSGHRILGDADVRRAISLAIDRPGIAAAVLREPRAAATQLFPPSVQEWHVAGLQPLTRDLQQARQLLASRGWTPGADGWLSRGGVPFKVTLRTYPDRPELPVIAAAVQAQLKQVGIDVVVAIGNSSEVPSGHKDGSLELALVARNYALVPDPIGTMLQDFGPEGGDWGAMNWRSASVGSALDALSLTDDPQRRSVQRGVVATVIQAELPVIPIAWYQHTATSSTRLAGVSIDPLERSYRLSRMKWVK
jgi:peptide/nickel transport system substrate-binding protein